MSPSTTSLYTGRAPNDKTNIAGLPTIDGLTAIASNVVGNKAFGLFRVEKEGLQLLKIAGVNGTTSGAYSVKLFITGDAGFSIVADDGYAVSQVATVTVNVSNAPLVTLDFAARAPRLSPRASQLLQLVGDFADEQNVALPTSYLRFQSTNPAAGIVTLHASRATLHGLTEGTGVITASTAHGPGGVVMQAATAFSIGLPTDQTQQFLYALGLDVFPGAVSLGTGSGTGTGTGSEPEPVPGPVPIPPRSETDSCESGRYDSVDQCVHRDALLRLKFEQSNEMGSPMKWGQAEY